MPPAGQKAMSAGTTFSLSIAIDGRLASVRSHCILTQSSRMKQISGQWHCYGERVDHHRRPNQQHLLPAIYLIPLLRVSLSTGAQRHTFARESFSPARRVFLNALSGFGRGGYLHPPRRLAQVFIGHASSELVHAPRRSKGALKRAAVAAVT